MKKVLLAIALLVAAQVVSKADLKFDGNVYTQGWEAKTNGVTIKEFYTQKETTNTWKTMITFQSHPGVTNIAKVSGPYFEARKAIVALPPKAHSKKPDDSSDVILELFLGKPGMTDHLEFVLARFIQTPTGVYLMVYSYRLPLSKRKNQDINVNAVMKNKDKWIQELFEVPVESIKQRF
jgi:hypothetical protein